ncbi:MAG: sodium:solute symporter [Cryomorphaceae bacterium]|nr:sodium:solute symporter [Cryomorphaceae bacterium]
MSTTLILALILGYFALLVIISRFTAGQESNANFFLAGKSAPWFLVAFGMIGASLSGITFISIPGKVGNPGDQFSYMQIVIGYLLGYLFIAYVLMPVYYRLQLTSIYSYLDKRFGIAAYKTGAFYFLLSRTIGASIRLLLVANVLQAFLFNDLNVPFEATVAISIGLIWVYTYRGGIKTIIWTDTLQTLFMLVALGVTLLLLINQLDFGPENPLVSSIANSGMTRWFFFDNAQMGPHYFWKDFIGGFFICIGMTGMDQDMMQKNLACKNIREAQMNMMSFAGVLFVVNLLFLILGVFLFMYAAKIGIEVPVDDFGKTRTDLLFPEIALRSPIAGYVGVFFLIGLIAAAYSSADSALTSLTTSVCVDILNIEKHEEKRRVQMRKVVHIAMSALLFVVILILNYTLDLSAIDQLITLAGYTYGPLIGMFAFGLFTKHRLSHFVFPIVALLAPILTFYINLVFGTLKTFTFGASLIALNGGLTFGMLLLASIIPFLKKTPQATRL